MGLVDGVYDRLQRRRQQVFGGSDDGGGGFVDGVIQKRMGPMADRIEQVLIPAIDDLAEMIAIHAKLTEQQNQLLAENIQVMNAFLDAFTSAKESVDDQEVVEEKKENKKKKGKGKKK